MLKLYNSLTKQKEVFKPIHSPKVGLYVCGITVYDYCHMGHARTNVMTDVMVRVLRYLGYDVTYVRNITDIDDKIIQRANERQESCEALTERFIQAMWEDEARLGIQRPDIEPRATVYIDHMIQLIAALIAKKQAYVAENGDVCYQVRTFPEYGCLSHRTLDDLRAGERVELVSEKRDPLDFVLWKLAKPNEPSWPSPWGNGRPGWHTECAVMSHDCLGEHFDIHGGGMDLLFPHHENELAQAKVVSNKPFANYWVHFGFLMIRDEKMSKSLGNFFTIRDVLQQYDAESVRYFLLSNHYRKPLNYEPDVAIPNARQALSRFYTALRGLPAAEPDASSGFEVRFKEALEDDFNIPQALSVLFDLVREINRLKEVDLLAAARQGALLKRLTAVLGIVEKDPDLFLQGNSENAEMIHALIEKRNTARKQKDFATADAVRRELSLMGIEIEDTATGTLWRKSNDLLDKQK